VVRLLGAGALAAVALGAGSASAQGPAVKATATLTPRAVLFGDTVTARVDATVDRGRVDPGRLRLRGSFAPYEADGPVVTRVRGDDVRLIVRLSCWTTACLTGPKRHRLLFPPATLDYGTGSLRIHWPALERYSRLDPIDLASSDPRNVAPWRGDATATPRVSYAIAPGLLFGLLLGASVVLFATAAVLGVRLVPRWRFSLGRRRAEASPLERALLVLEAAWARGAADQRKALELLAAELESQGEPPLAGQARELAWSQTAPEPDAAQTLAASVREVIGARSNGHRA
jgi:hypothetical protein